MKKDLADLVDAALPAVFGLVILLVPPSVWLRRTPEVERPGRARKLRLMGGLLVTLGAASVAVEWLSRRAH